MSSFDPTDDQIDDQQPVIISQWGVFPSAGFKYDPSLGNVSITVTIESKNRTGMSNIPSCTYEVIQDCLIGVSKGMSGKTPQVSITGTLKRGACTAYRYLRLDDHLAKQEQAQRVTSIEISYTQLDSKPIMFTGSPNNMIRFLAAIASIIFKDKDCPEIYKFTEDETNQIEAAFAPVENSALALVEDTDGEAEQKHEALRLVPDLKDTPGFEQPIFEDAKELRVSAIQVCTRRKKDNMFLDEFSRVTKVTERTLETQEGVCVFRKHARQDIYISGIKIFLSEHSYGGAWCTTAINIEVGEEELAREAAFEFVRTVFPTIKHSTVITKEYHEQKPAGPTYTPATMPTLYLSGQCR